MKTILIEIQYFNDCPNAAELIKRVRTAIGKNEEDICYWEVLVETNKLAQHLKFRGSPTLLINGNDFEEIEEPSIISLSCRYYAKGLPTIEEIKRKINSYR